MLNRNSSHRPRHHLRHLIRTVFLFFLVLESHQCFAENAIGITDTAILIGQSCALTGPAMGLGTGMNEGAKAYFTYINSMGGINGKKIQLIAMDDAFDPDTCAANTATLIDEDKVFLLFGYVGSPTTKAAIAKIENSGIPLFAPVTGAESFRTPVIPNVFNLRASYAQETAFMVERLIKDKNASRIAVYYQNDPYGNDGLNGAQKAAAQHGLSVIASASYERNAPDASKAVTELMEVDPEAVILVGSSKPCGDLIAGMRGAGSNALFLNISFVNGEELAANLSNDGIGVVVTQVTPFPFYRKNPVVAEYNLLIAEVAPDATPTSAGMEGFVAAKALCKILMETPPPLTREAFIATAEQQIEADIGGYSFTFTPERHQGSDLIYLTQIGPGGYLTPINNLGQLYKYHHQ